MKIIVLDDIHTRQTRKPSPDNSWDRGDTEENHFIRGIKIVKDDYCDFDVQFNVIKGKTYYLLSVFYDTGDSFGNDDNRVEHIDLYESEDLANECASRIASHARSESDNWESHFSVLILTNKGTEYRISAHWVGYFDRFREARVTPVELKEIHKSFK